MPRIGWTFLAFASLSAMLFGAARGAEFEWTLEHARKQWEPMTKSVQNVGVPGCQWQVGVFWDGALLFGQTLLRGEAYRHPRLADEIALARLGDNMLHVSVGFGAQMRLLDRAGSNSPLIRKGLCEGRLPMPFVESRDGDLVWRETVFAHLLERKMEAGMEPRPDDVLVVQVKFTARNAGLSRRVGHLWLHFGDATKTRSASQQLPELAPALAHAYEAPFGMLEGKVRYAIPTPSRGQVRWHDGVPAPPGTIAPGKRVLEWEVPLAAGEQAELRLVLPYGLVEKEVAARAAALDYETLWQAVAKFWRSVVSGPCRIVTPDPWLNDYLAATAGQIAQQVGYRHKAKIWMLKTAPNWYEDYYLACAARALPSLDLRGLERYTRPVLQSMADFQSDDASGLMVNRAAKTAGIVGSEGYPRRPGYLCNFGPPGTAVPLGDPKQGWSANDSLMGHGLALHALAAHYRIARDGAWLGGGAGSKLQSILDACDWIAAQRKRTMREENGKKVPHWGLLPSASAHDWLSGNAIFNDAWCIYGMAEAVRMLWEIRHPRAEELAKELQDYRSCLSRSYAAARDGARRLPLDDGREIPFVPRMTNELDWARVDWTITGYGPLRAGGLGAFDPRNELVTQALAFLEAGRPSANDPQAREYFWRHYVETETHWPMDDVFLNRDDLPRFFELLFNNLAAAVHEDFRVGCEARNGVASCSPSDAERWRMIRNMFVREFGGYDGSEQSLWLMQALPRSWLKPGDRLSVEEMGTAFGGKIDLTVEVAGDGDSVAVDVEMKQLAVKPKEIRMRLRSGDGRPLASATVNGRTAAVRAGDLILLPATTDGAYRVVGGFR
ncbi:MAG: hypothetical protein IT426_06340 [Pirellulales bacterium]|nr:hypothetical protein [Pirellulales bacterium]